MQQVVSTDTDTIICIIIFTYKVVKKSDHPKKKAVKKIMHNFLSLF